MTTHRKNYFPMLAVLCFAFFSISFFWNASDVIADDIPLQPEGYSSDETFRYMEVIISKKDGNTIVTMDDHSFPVLKEAIILDAVGNRIQLSELPTPCEARIRYRQITR